MPTPLPISAVVLARNEVDYKIPVMLNDDLYIAVWCSKVGTKSLEYKYEVIAKSNGNDIVKATGASVMVCYDYKSQKTIEVPELWRKLLS